jgi:hypothetical protein
MRALVAVWLLAAIGMTACGGGGGGGGGGVPSGGGAASGNSDRGGFTLGSSDTSLKVLRGDPSPIIRIPITVTGSDVAVVGAAFVGQSPPPWLFVTIEGTGTNLTLVLSATTTTFEPGHYAATVTLGTADKNAKVLFTREVLVTLDLVDGISVNVQTLDVPFVFGSSDSTKQVDVTVAAQGKSWTITSNKPWLPVPSGTQQGDAKLKLTVDAAAAVTSPGSATAEVVIQDVAEPIDRRVLPFTVNATAPTPVLSVNPIVLGNRTGLGDLTQLIDLSIDTGTNAYPWTLKFNAQSPSSWIGADAMSGNVSGAQHSVITLGVSPSIGAAGDHTAVGTFEVTVANQTFSTAVPISLKWQGQRLVPENAGVAFSKFPSGLIPASRSVKINSSRGVAEPWTASSDQSWLSVTPSGTTGDRLVLTPNPSGLASGQLHIATVTLSSTSSAIERSEKIRVGLWVGSSNPSNVDVILPTFPIAMTVNPVEPYAYVLYNDIIHVYNVHSGAELPPFTGSFSNQAGGFSYPVSMDVSSDGAALYVANGATTRVTALNAATGATLANYQANSASSNAKVRYVRSNGYPILWTPFGDYSNAIDLETGAFAQMTRDGYPSFGSYDSTRAFTPDGEHLFTMSGTTTSDTLNEFTTRFGVFGGRVLEVNPGPGAIIPGAIFTRLMCVSSDGARIYLGQSSLYEVGLDGPQPHLLRQVTLPANTAVDAMDCNWNGRVYAGLSTFGSPQDNVLSFDSSGNDAGSFSSGPPDSGIIETQMHLSGDAHRVISVHVVSGNPDPVTSLHFYNVPQ